LNGINFVTVPHQLSISSSHQAMIDRAVARKWSIVPAQRCSVSEGLSTRSGREQQNAGEAARRLWVVAEEMLIRVASDVLVEVESDILIISSVSG